MTESVLIEPKLFRLRALSSEESYSPRKRKDRSEDPLTPEQVDCEEKRLKRIKRKIKIESTLAFLLLSTERTIKMSQTYYDYRQWDLYSHNRNSDFSEKYIHLGIKDENLQYSL